MTIGKEYAPLAQGTKKITNNYQHTDYNKKFPPYGRVLDEIRRKNLIPLLRVICTTDWELGAVYPRIVIPQNAKPERLEFRYLAGLSVEIVHHDGEDQLVKGLADEILKVKPKSLISFNYDIGIKEDPKYRASKLIYRAQEVIQNDL